MDETSNGQEEAMEQDLSEDEMQASRIIARLKELNPDIAVELDSFSSANGFGILVGKVLSLPASAELYQILGDVFQLKPTLVESNLSQILDSILMQQKEDEETQKAYAKLLLTTSDIFAKLQRFPKLIAKVFLCLRNQLFEEVTEAEQSTDCVLPSSFIDRFGLHVGRLPVGQVLEIWRTLLYNLLEENVKRIVEGTIDQKTVLFLEANVTIFSKLLMNAKVADSSVPALMTKKVAELMTKMKEEALNKVGVVLLTREHHVVVTKNFLQLAYCWGELHILMCRLSRSYTTNMTPTFGSNPDFSFVHSYMSSQEWQLLGTRINNFGETPCLCLWSKMTVQMLKATRLFGTEPSLTVHFAPSLKFLLNNLEHSSGVLSQDVVYLAPYLNTLQLMHVCAHAVQQVARGCVTWKVAVQEPTFQESRNLVAGVLFHAFSSGIAKLSRRKKRLESRPASLPDCTGLLQVLDADRVLTLARGSEEFFGDDNWTWLQGISDMANEAFSKVGEEAACNLNARAAQTYFQVMELLPLSHLATPLKVMAFVLATSILVDAIRSSDGARDTDFLSPVLERVLARLMDGAEPPVMHFLGGSTLTWLGRGCCDSETRDVRKFLFQRVAVQAVKSAKALSSMTPAVEALRAGLREAAEDGRGEMAVVLMDALFKESQRKRANPLRRKQCAKYSKSLRRGFLKAAREQGESDSNSPQTICVLLSGFTCFVQNGLQEELETDLMSSAIDLAFVGVDSENKHLVTAGFEFLNAVCERWESLSQIVPGNFTERLWNAYGSNLHAEQSSISQLLFRNNEYLKRILSKFYSLLEHSLSTPEDPPDLAEYIPFWDHVFTSSLEEENIKTLSKAFHNIIPLTQMLLSRATSTQTFTLRVTVPMLKVQAKLLSVHRIHLFPEILGMCFHSLTSIPLKEIQPLPLFVETFQAICDLLNNLLLHHAPLAMDRLASYIEGLHHFFSALADRSKQENNFSEEEVKLVLSCTPHMERICVLLKRYPKDVCKVAPYSVALIVKEFETHTLYPTIKERLQHAMHKFLDLCDEHGIAMLHASLSATSSEIFKNEYDNYVKYYKYEGRV